MSSRTQPCRPPSTLVALLVLVFGAVAPVSAQVVYVDAAATGAGSGASWGDAFPDLQAALAVATDGDQLWVAAGSYAPAGPGGLPTTTFTLPGGVALYGGFAGGELLLSQRDPVANPTILSGDLNGDDAPGQPTKGDNVDHVLSVTSAGPTTRLDGFTVRGGYATASSGLAGTGSGLLVSGGAVTAANCRFDDCLATWGGAITALGATLTVQDGDFTCNRAWSGRGGALYIASGSVLGVARCDFTGNTSQGGGGVGDGGAAFLELGSSGRFEECSFSFNTSSGAQPNYANGGGLANGSNSHVLLSNTIAWGNSSPGQPTFEAQVHNLSGGHASIRHSCVQALLETIPGEDPPDPANFPGSFDDDPLFVSLGALDLHLSAGSPCIDAGDNGALPGDVSTDLDGLARFTDDPSTPDTGLGSAPIVDLGVYEFGSEVSPWSDLGLGLAGAAGVPVLVGSGALHGGDPVSLSLTNALPGSLAHLVLGATFLGAPPRAACWCPRPTCTCWACRSTARAAWCSPAPGPAASPAA